MGYETTWPVFVAIIAFYLVISLVIGGKKAYFEQYQEKPDLEEQK